MCDNEVHDCELDAWGYDALWKQLDILERKYDTLYRVTELQEEVNIALLKRIEKLEHPILTLFTKIKGKTNK